MQQTTPEPVSGAPVLQASPHANEAVELPRLAELDRLAA